MSIEPNIKVGIIGGPSISFELHGRFFVNGAEATGPQTVTAGPGRSIVWNGAALQSLRFTPCSPDSSFTLRDVVIGVQFHWQRHEDQTFKGALEFLYEKDVLTAVNVVPVEEYLTSVISSEMSATASLDLLKAHAVISRSWLLAQIRKHDTLDAPDAVRFESSTVTDDETVRWFDREDHVNFHVCADDHCQRYQGITRRTTENAGKAVAETRGLVLTYDGEICDARFSKCCGGVFEEFENCWEPVHYRYLSARADSLHEGDFPNLRIEKNAISWLESRPKAFCNCDDPEILGQVLNNYDRETTDFYRWRVEYTQQQLADLIRERSGLDYGSIIDLEPLERGTSGRIVRLRIRGTRLTRVIGKELEIRRTLSKTHLYSSAFTVECADVGDDSGLPARFILRGAGWGHGVGLCQIGAAVMGARGISYRDILAHYFPESALTPLYL